MAVLVPPAARGARRLHRLIGPGVGALLVLMGLSGALLVNRAQLEPWKKPAPGPGGPARLISEQLQDAARIAPGFRVRQIQMINGTPGALLLNGADARGLSGTIVCAAAGPCAPPVASDRTLSGWLVEFHHNLLLKRTGRKILGGLAFLVLVLVVSGLLLVRRKNPAAPGGGARGWHRLAGMIAVPPLLLAAVTALGFAFPDAAGLLLNRPKEVRSSAAPAPLSPDRVMQDAIAALPGEVTALRLPGKPGDPWLIRIRTAEDREPEGRSAVYLDAATGAVLRVDALEQMGWRRRLQVSLFMLHTGHFLPAWLRPAWLLVGLLPALLWITGLRLTRAAAARR